MTFKMLFFALAIVALGCAGCDAYNISGPELTQRLEFADDALQFNYPSVLLFLILARLHSSSVDPKFAVQGAPML